MCSEDPPAPALNDTHCGVARRKIPARYLRWSRCLIRKPHEWVTGEQSYCSSCYEESEKSSARYRMLCIALPQDSLSSLSTLKIWARLIIFYRIPLLCGFLRIINKSPGAQGAIYRATSGGVTSRAPERTSRYFPYIRP